MMLGMMAGGEVELVVNGGDIKPQQDDDCWNSKHDFAYGESIVVEHGNQRSIKMELLYYNNSIGDIKR